MESKRETKKLELRNRLINAAEAQIRQNGLRGLKARDVTKDAGCALGALYNAVQDLDELIMFVNSRTLARLGQVLRQAVPSDAPPKETLQALAGAYLTFAQGNTNQWSAIFNFRVPDGAEVPEWHAAEYAILIEEIIAPLAEMRPDFDANTLRLRAQTLFASVHGVVQLSIQGRFVGIAGELLAQEVEALVDTMARGLTNSRPA